MKKIIAKWTILIMVLALTAIPVLAYLNEPTPPNDMFNVTSVSRRPYLAPQYIWAEAGNVSELRINTSTVTRGWQGYYGNITGVIVLDDNLNNTMYAWDLADPEGEIFATRNSSVNWSDNNIICAAISHIQTEETRLNFNGQWGQDVDGINETFSFTTHPAFTVANNTFAADECGFVVSTYVNDTTDSGRHFNETLLWSTSDDGMIYMAFIIQGGYDGFKVGNTAYDFQMLVGEDGHDGDTSPTQYYFWVEIE